MTETITVILSIILMILIIACILLWIKMFSDSRKEIKESKKYPPVTGIVSKLAQGGIVINDKVYHMFAYATIGVEGRSCYVAMDYESLVKFIGKKVTITRAIREPRFMWRGGQLRSDDGNILYDFVEIK